MRLATGGLAAFIVFALLAPVCESEAADDSWSVLEFVDEWEEPTGKKGVRSKLVEAGPSSAVIVFEDNEFATMRFTYLNLTGGSYSVTGNTEQHSIAFKIGGRQSSFRVSQPIGEEKLWLGQGPTQFILKAIGDDAGDVLMVRMRFYSDGNVVFRFPLAGAKVALKSAGILEGE